MFECFGRKRAHRRARKADLMALYRTARDGCDMDVLSEAWLEYRQERAYWSCPCAVALGVAVSPAAREAGSPGSDSLPNDGENKA